MIDFDGAGLVFVAIGCATFAAALLPRLLGRLPVSMPMVFLGAGIVLFAVFPDLPDPRPMENPDVALHLTEVCVIISLMGAGLAINRPFGWRSWSTTWRLLAITMPLSIIALTLIGFSALGLGIASAVLLAAALAPTDPVLATEVQVSEPVVDEEGSDSASDSGPNDDEVRFAITSEAGLNDGLAFPFTYAAIAISVAGIAPQGWLGEWMLVDVLWRTAVGVIVGLLIGWMLRRLFFSSIADRLGLAEKAEGFVALAATFLAYGIAETAEGYGFVAVFVCACTIRAAERQHSYHRVLHNFVEQIERLLTVLVLLLLGGAIARGLFAEVEWVEIVVAIVFLFVIRPLTGWLALTPGKTGGRERRVIAFFGVRGVGSLFYIAYALEHGSFPEADRLWAIVSLVIVGSILIHGVAATPVMARIDARRERIADQSNSDPESTPV